MRFFSFLIKQKCHVFAPQTGYKDGCCFYYIIIVQPQCLGSNQRCWMVQKGGERGVETSWKCFFWAKEAFEMKGEKFEDWGPAYSLWTAHAHPPVTQSDHALNYAGFNKQVCFSVISRRFRLVAVKGTAVFRHIHAECINAAIIMTSLEFCVFPHFISSVRLRCYFTLALFFLLFHISITLFHHCTTVSEWNSGFTHKSVQGRDSPQISWDEPHTVVHIKAITVDPLVRSEVFVLHTSSPIAATAETGVITAHSRW